jgi:transposase-like protein
MIASTTERPMCPICKHRMTLARNLPNKRGSEERTFECSSCRRTDKISTADAPRDREGVFGL